MKFKQEHTARPSYHIDDPGMAEKFSELTLEQGKWHLGACMHEDGWQAMVRVDSLTYDVRFGPVFKTQFEAINAASAVGYSLGGIDPDASKA